MKINLASEKGKYFSVSRETPPELLGNTQVRRHQGEDVVWVGTWREHWIHRGWYQSKEILGTGTLFKMPSMSWLSTHSLSKNSTLN